MSTVSTVNRASNELARRNDLQITRNRMHIRIINVNREERTRRKMTVCEPSLCVARAHARTRANLRNAN